LIINELHKLACTGDKTAQEKLFQHLSDSFLIFAQHKTWNKSDAEEIVQETLMTITSKYREIEFEISFSAWAYQVLENKLKSFFRTKAGRANKDRQMADGIQASPVWMPNPSLQIKLRNCLQIVSKYGRQYARIINFSYLGLETGEICRRLNTTPSNVYNMLSRARRMLRKCLDKGDIK
jgi:RNA polymerase sigma factor (sigma-70 family)